MKEAVLSLNLKINSNEKQPIHLNSRNDYDADIISIIAILQNNKCESPTNFLIYSIETIFLFHQSDQLIRTMLLIIDFSFNLSQSPIIMSAIILNCLHLAIKKTIFGKLIFFSQGNKSVNSLKKLFLTDEISFFSKIKSEISFENENDLFNIINSNPNNDKFQFINDIDNAVISLLNEKSVFYRAIIASILHGNIDYRKIKDYEKQINEIKDNSQDDSQDESFILDGNIDDPNIRNQIKEKAECYLLYHIESSFIYLDCICDLQIKNDSMRYVSRQLQYIGAMSIIKNLMENLDTTKVESLVLNIIDPIEKAISSRNISSFFIPSILSILPIDTAFYTLYVSVSYAKDNWYNEVMDLIKKSKSSYLDEEAFNEILRLAKDCLEDQKETCTELKYQEEIASMKKEISSEIEKSLDRVLKLIQVSTKRARENISRNMNINLLLNQVEEYRSFLMSIKTKQYNDKFHKYLDSSISELFESTKFNINSYAKSVPSVGFNANESLKNIDDLLKRVSDELNTVIHIFNISDDYKLNDNDSKIISSEDILNCSSKFSRYSERIS